MKGIFPVLKFRIACILTLLSLSVVVQAQVDLNLSKHISTSSPSVGSSVVYTLIVKNDGNEAATGVVVSDSLPSEGVSYVSHQVVRGGGSFNSGSGIWTVGTVAAGDSAVLTINTSVLQAGVYFSVSEITAMNEADEDSRPGDRALNQDDLAVACFSVPVTWTLGDEYVISVPSGYKGIKWLYNGNEIVGAVVVNNKTIAVVNNDSTLTVKGPGSFSFTAKIGGLCPASGCCAFEVVPGDAGSIGDLVWYDDNGNGVLDELEEGVAGVTVTLYDCDQVKLATTISDPNGQYLFTDLPSGNYQLAFAAPSGALFARGGVINSNGKTNCITINTQLSDSDSLRNNAGIDAAMIRFGTIGSYAWQDLNENGVKESDEPVVPGITVQLLDSSLSVRKVTVTNEEGIYLFDSLTTGSYFLKFIPPTGQRFTNDINNQGVSKKVTPDVKADWQSAARNVTSISAGLAPSGTYDLQIALKLSERQSPTVEPGDTVRYQLSVFNKGTFAVRQIGLQMDSPSQLTWLDEVPSLADTLHAGDSLSIEIKAKISSNIEQATITSRVQILSFLTMSGIEVEDIFLDDNQDSVSVQVAKRFGSIGDLVWYDDNNNGIRENSEKAAPGVTIQLFDCSNNKLATAISDQDGHYQFQKLESGTYKLFFTQPTGAIFTTNGLVNQNGHTSCITLNTRLEETDSLRNNTAIDAGIVRLGKIDGYAWQDADRDGNRTNDELGWAGITVQLRKNQSTVLATTLTDGEGNYLFDGLTAGNYYVKFIAPTGQGFTNGLSDAGLSSAVQIEFDSDSGAHQIINAGLAPTEVAPSGRYDLSLAASLAAGQAATVQPGDTVHYQVVVRNEGDFGVSQIQLGGTLPAQLTLIDTASVASGVLNPGDSLVIPAKVVVHPDYRKGTLMAYAEVVSFRSATGEAVPDSNLLNNRDSVAIAVEKLYGSIGSLVWNDINGNGNKENGETGFPGITVQLRDTLSTVLSTTITNENGQYQFDSLSSGAYVVRFIAPSDYNYTNGISEEGLSGVIRLNVKEENKRNILTINAGLAPTEVAPSGRYDLSLAASLAAGQAATVQPGDTVHYQVVVRNEGDFGVSQIQLGGTLPAELTLIDTASVVSGVLNPGDSLVIPAKVVVHPDYRKGTLMAYAEIVSFRSATGEAVPDSNLLNNRDSVAIAVEKLYGSIGSLVWNDINGNGNKENGETGFPGITVQLRDTSSTVLATTITNENGQYQFDSLSSGAYVVRFIAPSDYNYTNGISEEGLSGVIRLNVKEENKRNILTINAGIKVVCDSVSIELLTAPVACAGDSVLLSALSGSADASIAWYRSANAAMPEFVSVNGDSIKVVVTDTTEFYAEATTTNGCVSARKKVNLTVGRRPAMPLIAGTHQNTCPETVVTLSQISLPSVAFAGNTFEWRTTASADSALVPDSVSVDAGSYYLFEKTESGCYSTPAMVVINKIDCACDLAYGVEAGADQQACEQDSVTVTAVLSGAATAAAWSTSGTGRFVSPDSLTTTYVPSADDVAAGTVTLTVAARIDSSIHCTATKSDALVVTFLPLPAPVYGLALDDTLICAGQRTNLFGFTTSDSIRWYTEAVGGIAFASTKSGFSVTVSPTTTTTYYAESVRSSGCAGERVAITLFVERCSSELAIEKKIVTPGPYVPGQEVVYSIAVTNKGEGNARDIIVEDRLPAGLVFAGAVPSDAYDQEGGIWTIGSMAGAESRTLLINATIADSVEGSITNVAVVKSSAIDSVRNFSDTSSVTIRVSLLADLKLVQTASRSNVQKGDTVTYSIEISNAGPLIATNVQAMVLIPSALQVLPGSLFTAHGDTLKVELDSVAINESRVLTFSAIVEEKGIIKTFAQISHSDQKDPDSTPGNGFENGEDDESAVTISAGCDAVIAPVIACAKTNVCAGAIVYISSVGCSGGTVNWSNGMTGDQIRIVASETTAYTATCRQDSCISDVSNRITVYVNAPVVPVLTSDVSTVCAGGSATLSASNCTGTVVWSTGEETASIVVLPTETTTYTAYCKEGNCVSETASIVIKNSKPSAPVVECDCKNASICPGESVLLSAMQCSGVVKWSNGMNGESITVSPSVTTSYQAVCVVNGCESDSSSKHTVKVVVPQKPVIAANTTTACPGSTIVLKATGCVGTVTWSNNMTGDSISVKVNSSQSFSAVCKVNACASEHSNTVAVKVAVPSSPIVSASKSVVCSGDSVNLRAIGCEGTVVWSGGQQGASVFIQPTSTQSYTAQCKIGTCMSNNSNSVKVNVNTAGTPPVIAASKTAVCQGESVTLTATGCAGTVRWSNGMTGNPIVIQPVSGELYHAICAGQETCASGASNTLTFNYNLIKPVTKALANTCPEKTVRLMDGVTSALTEINGKFEFHTGNTTSSPLVAKPDSVGAGTYYVFEKTLEGCYSEPSAIEVTISTCENPEPVACVTNPATANAGADRTLCSAASYALNGAIGGVATSATWTSSGKGTFSDVHALNPVYYPSIEDFIDGQVVFTLTTNDPDGDGACKAASDEMKLTIEAVKFRPAISINGVAKTDTTATELTICAGESVSLQATDVEDAYGNKYTYKWNTMNSSESNTFVVRESGTYSVALVTVNGCSSVSSSRVIVRVITPATPVTIRKTNTCPETTVDLRTAVSSQPGEGGTFEFRTGSSLSSPLVSTPGAVGAGNYFVVEKSATGCYSAPAAIDIDITTCTIDQPEIGAALSAPDIINNGNGSFDVTYQVIIKNRGGVDMTQVEAVTSLTQTYEGSSFSIVGVPVTNSGSRLATNSGFNGKTDVNLLKPELSALTAGKADTLRFTVKVTPEVIGKTFYSTVTTKGKAGEEVSIAQSTNGIDPDVTLPQPTPVEFFTEISPIGAALAVKDTISQPDGSYLITYQVTVKNYGTYPLTQVQINNSLNEVFNSGNGASFKKVGTPIVGTGSGLKVNPDFDGAGDTQLVLAENSTLAAAKADTVWFTINVKTDGRESPYLNTVTVYAKSGDMIVSDRSTNGLNPDPNGNNDPTEEDEAEPTPIVLPLIIDRVFVPEGFSPNGDGVNDLFVIQNTEGQKVSLEVYSRWMTLVYKNDDYKNDWDGTSNSGIRLGSNASGLPDGTYFYIVRLSNGKRYMRSMTLTR